MKKYNKTLLNLATITLSIAVVLVMVACGNSNPKQDSLRQAVKEANSQCPMQNDMGECTGIKYENDIVEMTYTANEKVFPVSKLKNNEALLKRALAMSYFGENNNSRDQIFDLIIAAGSGLRAVFNGEDSKQSLVFEFTNAELVSMKKAHPSVTEQLDLQCQITSLMVPLQLDAFTTMTDMKVDGDYLTYFYTIDESKMSMKDFKENLATMQQSIATNVQTQINDKDSSAGIFFNLVARAGKGLRYSYKGSNGGEPVNVDFSNSDLRQMSVR